MKRFLFAIAAVAVAFSLRAPAFAADVQIVTPAYTLTCASHMQGKRVVLDCVPSHTHTAQASRVFDGWHYGQALPRAMFVQYVGNGAPAVCDGISINCSTGVVALNLGNANTWTATQTFANIIDSGLGTTAGTPVCITVASQLTTAGCTGGGGDTITSPNNTITPGGTSTASTLDVNLAHSNAWTAILTNTAQIQALGAGGANACAGTNYPATAYGYCAGANNGTNIVGAVFGPINATFACTATCTVGDSARIAFFDSNASGAGGRECDLWKVQASASLESGCGLIAAGSAGVQTSILRNQVANDWNGTCASVATGPHCVTASRSGQTETGLTCFQIVVTNHAMAIDTGVTLSNAAAYTFTSTIPNAYVGSTSTAPTTSDSVVWFCLKP